MALSTQQKSKIVSKHQTHGKDTGSPDIQVALFSSEIDRLVKHLRKHAKDNSSRVGLLKMVAKRRRLLEYLKRTEPKRYEKLIKDLDLKK
ncbi:MAG: 30S ribosomal protein S15 [Candidatus Paceibacterota bacterium]|nr:MAG: 30S ribosomal protein S15 [Candidatus Paceibacterota bacterium]